MSKITYRRVGAKTISVYLDGHRVGTIYPSSKGFQYRAETQHGKTFKTLDEVKQSLEATESE